VDRSNEDLAVADLAGACRLGDHGDHLLNTIVRHDDLDFHLGDEIDDVRRTAIDFLFTAGSPEAFDFGDRHTVDSNLGQAFLDLVELERLYDGLDLLHSSIVSASYVSCGFRNTKFAGHAGGK